jgi:Na+-driven multidrug efflux pump
VSDPVVIQYGIKKMQLTTAFIFLGGMMDVMVGSLRGVGASLLPTLVSLAGACGFRLVWLATVFQQFRSLETLYVSYPISWALTGIVQFICFMIVLRKIPKIDMEETI